MQKLFLVIITSFLIGCVGDVNEDVKGRLNDGYDQIKLLNNNLLELDKQFLVGNCNIGILADTMLKIYDMLKKLNPIVKEEFLQQLTPEQKQLINIIENS